MKIAVHLCSVNGSNPRSLSSNSSSLKIKAWRQKGPICNRPRPMVDNLEPFLADFRLAKDLVFGADMTTSLSTCMCSCRTRMWEAPESTSIVALVRLGLWPMCKATRLSVICECARVVLILR